MATKTYYHNNGVVGSVTLRGGVVVSLRPHAYYKAEDGLIVGRVPGLIEMTVPFAKRAEIVDLGAIAGVVVSAEKTAEAIAEQIKEEALASGSADVPAGEKRLPFAEAVSVDSIGPDGKPKLKFGGPKKKLPKTA